MPFTVQGKLCQALSSSFADTVTEAACVHKNVAKPGKTQERQEGRLVARLLRDFIISRGGTLKKGQLQEFYTKQPDARAIIQRKGTVEQFCASYPEYLLFNQADNQRVIKPATDKGPLVAKRSAESIVAKLLHEFVGSNGGTIQTFMLKTFYKANPEASVFLNSGKAREFCKRNAQDFKFFHDGQGRASIRITADEASAGEQDLKTSQHNRTSGDSCSSRNMDKEIISSWLQKTQQQEHQDDSDGSRMFKASQQNSENASDDTKYSDTVLSSQSVGMHALKTDRRSGDDFGTLSGDAALSHVSSELGSGRTGDRREQVPRMTSMTRGSARN
eukprot:TRINITY_DN45366_c0_g1_i1.p1 TRINITY_DN45366_c0_g1~~TRINITY_DN45366_c0_g1_i1.p1  ORF type:complete len:331 (-),score=55.23 TRINITY_DN45366_c0_g1_i1:77-1069(-)